MTEDDVDSRVLKLVAAWAQRGPETIALSTVINSGISGGLGVDGADADDLVAYVARGLGWSLIDFDYDSFFGPEVGWNPLSLVVDFFSRRGMRSRPLTVGQLAHYFFRSRPAGR